MIKKKKTQKTTVNDFFSFDLLGNIVSHLQQMQPSEPTQHNKHNESGLDNITKKPNRS